MAKPETQRRPARAMNSRTHDKNDNVTTKSSNNNGVKKGRVVTPPKGAVSINKNDIIHIVREMFSNVVFVRNNDRIHDIVKFRISFVDKSRIRKWRLNFVTELNT